jgi:hypothetical protein
MKKNSRYCRELEEQELASEPAAPLLGDVS